MNDFVNLHSHTHHSHMDAIIRIPDLFKRVAELGQSGIAITDHGVLSGIHEGYKEYRKYRDQGKDIKFIPGSEIYFCDDLSDPKSKRRHLVLLAQNEEGYRNLLKINAAGFHNSVNVMGRPFPRVDFNILKQHSAGLFVNSACGGSPFAAAIFEKNYDKARTIAAKFQDLWGDRFHIELQPHDLVRGDFNQGLLNEQLFRLAGDLKIPLIATCDSHYLTSKHEKYHDMALAIGSKRSLEDPKRHRYASYDPCLVCAGTGVSLEDSKTECTACGGSKYAAIKPCPEFYLKDRKSLEAYFTAKFDAKSACQMLDNTVAIAAQCEYPDYMKVKGHLLPAFPWKDESDAPDFQKWKGDKSALAALPEDAAYLRYVVKKGFDKLTADYDKEKKQVYWDRVKKELDILESKNFSSYMLIVADYIRWAKSNGIRVGRGRGCLKGDTLVLTQNGFVPLRDIRPDDMVYTHTGELKRVTHIMEYPVNEELLIIRTSSSFRYITLTRDHKVWGMQSDKSCFEPKWIAAENLQVGDQLFMPQLKRTAIKIPDLDLVEVFPNCIHDSEQITIYNSIKLKRFWKFDSEMMRFLGLWGHAGYINDYVVSIDTTPAQADWAYQFLADLGFSNISTTRHSKTRTVLRIAEQGLALIMNRILPNSNSPDRNNFGRFARVSNEQLSHLLHGYTGEPVSDNMRILAVNTHLAQEIREILLYLGFKCTAEYHEIRGLNGRRIGMNINATRTPEPGYYAKVQSIGATRAERVYDITVEDNHSYVTSEYAVHNSAGGSLVAYILGIHEADPIKYHLIFERFQNKEKTSLPDIDVDFAPSGREKVIDYCRNKYGERNVAYISNILRLTPKLLIKDIARSLVVGGDKSTSFKIANDITASIPDIIIKGDSRIKVDTMEKAMGASEKLSKFLETYPSVLEYANELVGTPRGFATHAAGVIISKKPLDECAPIRRDTDGAISIQYDKDTCEEIGLVKMDFLGLDTLDILDETIALAKSVGMNPPQPEELQDGDPKAYKLIHAGYTTGIFQLNGSMTPLCKAMAPKSIPDIAAISAIGRPSVASKDRMSFINRRSGKEKVKYPHPILEPVLKQNYGIAIYEEDLLRIAQHVAGWDLSDADGLRKMTKSKEKGFDLAVKLKKKFIQDAVAHSKITPEDAEHIWVECVEKFTGYGFNLSHATMYSMISYDTAYYKAHFPTAFLAANLNCQTRGNKADKEEIIEELKKDAQTFKIKIVPCDINLSKEYYSLVDRQTIITGLGAIKGVGDAALTEIIKHQPYSSFEDFLWRTPSCVNKTVIEALAKSGAMDSLGVSRKYIIENYASIRKELAAYAKKNGTEVIKETEEWVETEVDSTEFADDYDGGTTATVKLVPVKKVKKTYTMTPEQFAGFTPKNTEGRKDEYSLREKLEFEKEVLGFFLSGDMSAMYPGFFVGGRYSMSYSKLQQMVENINFPTEGIIVSMKELIIKKPGKNLGKTMCKMVLENLKGETVDISIWADQYERLKTRLKVGLPIRGMFKVNEYAGSKSLVLINVEAIYKATGDQ